MDPAVHPDSDAGEPNVENVVDPAESCWTRGRPPHSRVSPPPSASLRRAATRPPRVSTPRRRVSLFQPRAARPPRHSPRRARRRDAKFRRAYRRVDGRLRAPSPRAASARRVRVGDGVASVSAAAAADAAEAEARPLLRRVARVIRRSARREDDRRLGARRTRTSPVFPPSRPDARGAPTRSPWREDPRPLASSVASTESSRVSRWPPRAPPTSPRIDDSPPPPRREEPRRVPQRRAPSSQPAHRPNETIRVFRARFSRDDSPPPPSPRRFSRDAPRPLRPPRRDRVAKFIAESRRGVVSFLLRELRRRVSSSRCRDTASVSFFLRGGEGVARRFRASQSLAGLNRRGLGVGLRPHRSIRRFVSRTNRVVERGGRRVVATRRILRGDAETRLGVVQRNAK